MTRLILTILHPILWITKSLFAKKIRFYVPLKMNEKCYCKRGKLYKECHSKKDKEKGMTAYLILQSKRPNSKLQKRKYILFSEFKKKHLQKVYASDERVKMILGDVDYGALYIMGSHKSEKFSQKNILETDYDVAFDEGTFDID